MGAVLLYVFSHEIKMKFGYNSYYDKFLAFIFVRENI